MQKVSQSVSGVAASTIVQLFILGKFAATS